MFFVNESYGSKTLALFVFFKHRLTLVSFAICAFFHAARADPK